MTRIREADRLDRESIREVHLAAFSASERQIVSKLALDLLSEETTPETINLVAEFDGAVVGHIAFSPVTGADRGKWIGHILAPLGVKPDYQKRGIGSKLVASGIAQLAGKGVKVLFVYGDPNYYGRFGFDADAASRFDPPYDLLYPFAWQAIVLNDAGAAESTARISCVAALRDRKLW